MNATSHPPGSIFEYNCAHDVANLCANWQTGKTVAPQLLMLNRALAQQLGPDFSDRPAAELAAFFSDIRVSSDTSPRAQDRAHRQREECAPRLSDEQAALLADIVGRYGERYDLQLRRSEPAPPSRNGDAILGVVLREYLYSEAMYALDVPTTRLLAVVSTGRKCARSEEEAGPILARVAASQIRIGTFQSLALRKDAGALKHLADTAIQRQYPCLVGVPERTVPFYDAVVEAHASLIASWMLVGFVHGDMNIDSMTISGETIDYGRCAFVDHFEPDATFNALDKAGRYAFANQPRTAQWNLARFAKILISLVGAGQRDAVTQELAEITNSFPDRYARHWLYGMRSKLGLLTEDERDHTLITALFETMTGQDVDFTLFFRRLATALRGKPDPVLALFKEPGKLQDWLKRYEQRLNAESLSRTQRADAMDRINPLYIPRQHLVDAALSAATGQADVKPFHALLALVTDPFTERPGAGQYAAPARLEDNPYLTVRGH